MQEKSVVAFRMKDGSTVQAEASDTVGNFQRVSRTDGVIEATEDFEATISHIPPVAQAVMDALKEINNPEEISLELGLKFNAKAGVVFAGVGSEVAFKVAVKWKND